MAKTNSKSEAKTMDITKPGKSAPPSSSRPVIVSNRPIVKDPIVKSGGNPADLEDKESKLSSVSTTGKTVQPPSNIKILSEDKDKESDAPSETKKEEPTPLKIDPPKESEETQEEPKAAKAPITKPVAQESTDNPEKPEVSKPEQPKPAEEPSSPAETSAPSDDQQLDPKKKQEDKAAEAEKQKQETLQKLISEKTYFLPIGKHVRNRNNKRATLVLLVVVILAAAGFYILADAGLIHLPFSLPYHIFPQPAA